MSSSFPMYDMAEADTDPTNLLDDIYSSLIIPLLNELQQLRSPTRDQMPAHGKGKRPYKVWDSGRQVRKGLVVASFNELIEKGREKLELGEVRIKVVLEADGTQVEDPEYFCTLPENTVFLLLRQGEHWYPAGVEVLRQAITAIPKIVCETIYSLGLHDEAPVWKIMDQYGKITVVLSWDPCHRGDHRHGTSSPRKPSATATRMIVSGVGESAIQRHEYLVAQPSVGSTPSPAPTISLSGTKSPVPASGAAGISAQAPVGTVTTILRDGKKETLINDIGPAAATLPPAPHHQGTVINHDSEIKSSYMGTGPGATAAVVGRLSRQGSSVDSSHSATVHVHTPECCMYGHPHTPQPRTRASPTGDQAECDFHCCSLHEEGGRIQVHKAVATSPIQEGTHERRPAHHHTHPPSQSPGGKAAQPGAQAAAVQHPKGSSHVRFQTQTQTEYRTPNLEKPRERPDQDSSESETENTTNDEEAHTTEKFLLLTDQLSVDTKKHLSIKDIGVILDRLSSKIVDVEKLDREAEEEDCFNWTIKATIRGDTLRELGVVYNGHYYSISEHPGYGQKKEEEEEEEVAEAKDAEKEPV
ncbi:uncharacterized protein LOC121871795 isoform X2 [Homarus americanus]|uniref:uncharacterized protein LOC121871795 isoform X2 n=1 Tax=Homarus americanus TaxID=6706 RepID=UPI001C46FEB0|nr:uncharacterized protein LOC121871795 isoform X2 [Homarus americanus]